MLGGEVAGVDDGVVGCFVGGESDGAARGGGQAEYACCDIGAVHGRYFHGCGWRDGVHDGELVVGAWTRLEGGAIGAGGFLQFFVRGSGCSHPVHWVSGGVLGFVEGWGAESVALIGVL